MATSTRSMQGLGRSIQQQPWSAATLDETFERIKFQISIDMFKIKAIHLSNFFNIIQLDDLSIGAAINYYCFKSDQATKKTQIWLTDKLKTDPLLLDYLFQSKSPDLLQLSLKTCLISALSRNLLSTSSDFTVNNERDDQIFTNADSAVLVGLGGYMDFIIRNTHIKQIHINVPDYYKHVHHINKQIAYYKEHYLDKTITVSVGADIQERMATVDLICIRGCAFCDGQMDRWLAYAQKAKTIILQDQNVSIYPEALFKKGVSLISTTLKPAHLLDLANNEPKAFRNILEGNLPLIHITAASDKGNANQ